jgi:hypothetical protein
MNYKSGICIKRPVITTALDVWPIDINECFLLKKYLFRLDCFSDGEEFYDISTDKDVFDRGYVGTMSPEEIEEHFLILE